MTTPTTEIADAQKHLKGRQLAADARDFSAAIDVNDHKIAFILGYCAGKDVLDLGCVSHDPANYQSKYWVHRAIRGSAGSLLGVDLYSEGVNDLRKLGFNVQVGDAQNLNLGRTFDVIVAGDIIEHLEDFSGFFESCRRHLAPSGRLLISTPNPWYWKYFVRAALSVEVPNNPEHTCWLCPRTLRQLAARHDFDVERIAFGSRYLRDRLMPLPRGWKHTSFHAALFDSKNVAPASA
jgi:SAM-dependent methyltransferase